MNFLSTKLKNYLVAGSFFVIVALIITVIILGKCVNTYREEILGLEAQIEEKNNYIEYLDTIQKKDDKTDEKIQKKIKKINKSNNITVILNKLYKSNIPVSSAKNTNTEKASTPES